MYDDDRQSALTRALITAGASMMQPGQGGVMGAIGRGGMMGMNAYDQSFEQAQKRKLQEEMLRRAEIQRKLEEIGIQREAAKAEVWAMDFSTPAPAGMKQTSAIADDPSWRGSPLNYSSANAAPSVRQQGAESLDPMSGLRRKGQEFANRGMMAEAKSLEEYLKLHGEEFSTETKYDSQGVPYIVGKRGSVKRLDASLKPRDELVETDVGGSKVFRTKYDIKPVGEYGKTLTPDQIIDNQRQVSNQVYERTQKGKNDQFDMEQKFRKEFRGNVAVQNYESVMPIVKSALSAADTRAGDLNLIYAVGKVMDPGSVVREGEMIMVTNATSPAQYVMGYYNSLKGGGRLTALQRNELAAELRNRGGALRDQYQVVRNGYEQTAVQAGLDPNRIFINYGDMEVETGNPKASGTVRRSGSGKTRTIKYEDLPK